MNTSASFVITDNIATTTAVFTSTSLIGQLCPCPTGFFIEIDPAATPTPTPTPTPAPDSPAPQIQITNFAGENVFTVTTPSKYSLDDMDNWTYPIWVENVGDEPLHIFRIYARNYPKPYQVLAQGLEAGDVLCPGEGRWVSFLLDVDQKAMALDIQGVPTGQGIYTAVVVGIESNDPRRSFDGEATGMLASIRLSIYLTPTASDTKGIPMPAPTPAPTNICSFGCTVSAIDSNCDSVLDSADALLMQENRALLLGITP
ncbi:MAG: hypothetical protein SF028_09195 [Candidatus Sumerlaeia bacterium]|nr:hypothetical protein [Candidatus Sumerlaeia bacterium]